MSMRTLMRAGLLLAVVATGGCFEQQGYILLPTTVTLPLSKSFVIDTEADDGEFEVSREITVAEIREAFGEKTLPDTAFDHKAVINSVDLVITPEAGTDAGSIEIQVRTVLDLWGSPVTRRETISGLQPGVPVEMNAVTLPASEGIDYLTSKILAALMNTSDSGIRLIANGEGSGGRFVGTVELRMNVTASWLVCTDRDIAGNLVGLPSC